MVVVVIIGILAAIAVPAYTGFQDRAKSAEAKVHLSSIYTAEKAYFAEKNEYIDNLKEAGLGTSVPLKNYTKIGFAAGTNHYVGGAAPAGATAVTGPPAYPATVCSVPAGGATFKACAEKDTVVAGDSWYITDTKELKKY